MQGKLYIVSTPIGNLEDITLRALDVIRNSDYILAESSARTSKLLNHYNIKKRIVTFNKDNEKKKNSLVISDLNKGSKISLVTDAGTPVISDPGYELIKKTASKYLVVPIPGPSSLTCALSVSAIPVNNFIFLGFLPKKNNERLEKIKKISSMNIPMVMFESKHRIKSLVKNIVDIMGGDTPVIILRELTKLYESIKPYTAKKLLFDLIKNPLSGEITLIVDKLAKTTDLMENHKDRIKTLLKKHSASEVVSIIRLFTEFRKKELYKYVLKVRQEA